MVSSALLSVDLLLPCEYVVVYNMFVYIFMFRNMSFFNYTHRISDS